jgi:hypothetical protein
MSTTETIQIEGRIDARLHDPERLREEIPEWDDLDDREKYLTTTEYDDLQERGAVDGLDEHELALAQLDLEATDEFVVFNTTCVGLHEILVDNLDPTQTSDEEAAYLALGDDGASGTASGDESLNNEVFRKAVTDHADQGTTLLASTFVDSTEANGFTLDELGLFTSDTGGTNVLLNHSTFASATKDNTKTVTFDVTLSFSA